MQAEALRIIVYGLAISLFLSLTGKKKYISNWDYNKGKWGRISAEQPLAEVVSEK